MANQIKIIPAQVHNQSQHGGTVLRTTYSNSAQNQNLLKKLYAIVGDDFEINKGFDFSGVKTPSLDDLKNLLSEVIIRFDNDPDYYDKRDYQYLIWYLCQNLVYLHENSNLSEIKDDIKQLANRVDKIDPDLVEILDRISKLEEDQDEIPDLINTIESKLQTIESELQNKQDVLTAGSGINIIDDIVSATTTDDIKVTNVRIGRYTDNTIIQKGTDIMEILKNMLSKVIKMLPSSPSANYIVSPIRSQEYGTNVTLSEQVTFTQGIYKADDTSVDIADIPMDCQLSSVTGSGWSINGNKANRQSTIQLLKSESFPKDSLTAVFSQDTVGLNNSNPDIEILPYTTTSIAVKGSQTITPYFNVYVGYMYVDSQWSDEKRKEELLKTNKVDLKIIGELTGSSLTINKEFKSESPKLGMILACPSTYKLSEVVDFSNIPCTPSFTKITGTKNLTCANNIEHSYDLYLNDATSSYVQIKSVTFKKK